MYSAWGSLLPPEIQVCPVQLPGRENRRREEPFKALPPLVDALVAGLAPFTEAPFALFGYSLGALVGFELARGLRKRQLPGPVHLFASAHGAPQLARRPRPIHHLPDSAFIAELSRRFGAVPASVQQDRDLMASLLQTLKADMGMVEGYVYRDEDPLDCPITAIGGQEDSEVTLEELAAWRIHTRGAFHMEILPGDHFFIKSARGKLLRAISTRLSPNALGSTASLRPCPGR